MTAKAKLWVVTLNTKQKLGFSSLNPMNPWKALKKVKGMTMLDGSQTQRGIDPRLPEARDVCRG